MRIHRLISIGLGAYLLLPASSMAAEAISIEPGMWEITTKMTTSMFPQPRVETTQECMKDSEIGPDDLVPDDGGDCTITESKVSGNSMDWTMQCNSPGGVMTGGGNFTSKGNSGHGNMSMNMNIEGQSITMEMAWEGKRTGSC